VGHAIESLSEGKLYHGECVSIGMLYLISDDCRDRLKEVLVKYKLPTIDQFASEELIQVITHDKKANSTQRSRWVVRDYPQIDKQVLLYHFYSSISNGLILLSM
jgi:3-dehydroquinate synthetase